MSLPKKSEDRFAFRALFLRLRKNRWGATAVEFALVFPVFIVMVAGIVELSRAMWIKATLQFAIEQTARHAVVNTSLTTDELETYAATQLPSLSGDDITFTATSTSTGGFDYVTLSASYSFTTVIPIVDIPTIALNASTRVPISETATP
jgi:Flp pilus assembly protein TadG